MKLLRRFFFKTIYFSTFFLILKIYKYFTSFQILSPAIQVIPVDHEIKSTIQVPGSKSISNRALLFAALGKGSCKYSFFLFCIIDVLFFFFFSRIKGLLHSDDTQVMLESLQKVILIFINYLLQFL